MTKSRTRKKKSNSNYKVLVFFLLILIFVFIFTKQHYKKNNESNNEPNNTATSSNEVTQTNTEPDKVKPSIVENLSEEDIKLSKERGLPVLMYHFFYDASAGETGKDSNFMEIHDFEEQIKYLSENEYYVPTWEEVLGYIKGENGLPLKSIVITVDDGDESFFRLAVPVLEKYNFTATSFLITSWYTSPLDRAKYPSVIDFQSHSHNMHIPGSNGKGAFLTIDYNSACKDLETSRSIIGDDCRVFCYPFGHFNDSCKKTLKDCNYILAFTTQGGRVFPGDDPYELSRVRMSKGDSLNAFISKVK